MSGIIGLIPARSGSKRCPGKNTRLFFGHPLIAYTIAAAKESGIFEDILMSTDSSETLEFCLQYGIRGIIRPESIAQDTSTDLEWINDATRICNHYDYFAILRPTSPFRSGALIMDAYEKFIASGYDSIRTMEMLGHPGKMWEFGEFSNLVRPILQLSEMFSGNEFDEPTQVLHKENRVLTQNGCLQIAKTSLLPGSITGRSVYGYEMTGDLQGFDINTELDWILAEELVNRGMVTLPKI